MLLMLLGFTYESDKRFIVLHDSEIKYHYAECMCLSLSYFLLDNVLKKVLVSSTQQRISC